MQSAKSSADRRYRKNHSVFSNKKPRYQSEDNSGSAINHAELNYVPMRALVCGIIEQAFIDARSTAKISNPGRHAEHQLDIQSARSFFRSRLFLHLCDALSLDPESIASAALSLTPPPVSK